MGRGGYYGGAAVDGAGSYRHRVACDHGDIVAVVHNCPGRICSYVILGQDNQVFTKGVDATDCDAARAGKSRITTDGVVAQGQVGSVGAKMLDRCIGI